MNLSMPEHDHEPHNHWGDWGKRDHKMWPVIQAKRGDIGPLLLSLLAQKPMHGYEIIRHLEEKSHGMWRPSPGSVYPTLQLLEEQGLIKGREDDGKKVYELTEAGRAQPDKQATKAPWEWDKAKVKRLGELRASVWEIASLLRVVAHSGSEEKTKEARDIIEAARRKLQALTDETSTKEQDNG